MCTETVKEKDGFVCTKCGTEKLPMKAGVIHESKNNAGAKLFKCKVCGYKAVRYMTKEDYTKTRYDIIKGIQDRFLEISELDISDVPLENELLPYPITKEHHLQVKTDKEKSDKFSEVFTPLWLVDKMLDKTDTGWEDDTTTTLDLCAGYGQFTIRMIAKKYKILGDDFNVVNFLKNTHNFSELQPSSCFKLGYIFGKDINLYIGDSINLKYLDEKDKGIMYWSEARSEWVDIKNDFNKLVTRCSNLSPENRISTFEKEFAELVKPLDKMIRFDLFEDA